jgi:hypothetical protein
MNGPMIAVILFGIAALGGAFLAALRFMKKDLPLPVAFVHGGVAAGALTTLGVSVVQAGGPLTGLQPIALGLFVIAALGGFVLFSFHLRKKLLPIPLMLVHAVVAVAAYGCLLMSVFGHVKTTL